MEDAKTRLGIFLSLSKLGCSLQEFNSRKFHLLLIFKASWNNRDDVWKKHEFILIAMFSLPSQSSLLKLPVYSDEEDPKIDKQCKSLT